MTYLTPRGRDLVQAGRQACQPTYADRARITRRGQATLAAGMQTVHLGGLPATLDPDSVRAGGRGAGVRLLAVDVAGEWPPPAAAGDQTTAVARRQELLDAKQALGDARAGAEARLHWLDDLATSSGDSLGRGLGYGRATVADLDTLTAYLDRERAAGKAQLRDLTVQERALDQELAALQDRLTPPPSPFTPIQPPAYGVALTVDVAAPVEAELEVIYTVREASWKPLYDIRLAGDQVQVAYLAAVRQRSGEDWPALPLALSTAKPAVSATIPELQPAYLDVARPLYPSQPPGMAFAAPAPARAAQAAAGLVMSQSETAAAPPPPPVEVAEAEVEGSGGAVTYRIAHGVDIPSDGAPHKTTVAALSFPAKLDYVTVPRRAEEAYLRATITNASPYVFLPGPANVFHEDEFVAATAIKRLAPDAELKVSLGVDPRIAVTREITDRSTTRPVLIGNTRRVQIGFTITLTSHLPAPASITVWDQAPVSRHEQIKVRVDDVQPPATEQTPLNLLRWTLALPPGAPLKLHVLYTVEYPRDMSITGLSE